MARRWGRSLGAAVLGAALGGCAIAGPPAPPEPVVMQFGLGVSRAQLSGDPPIGSQGGTGPALTISGELWPTWWFDGYLGGAGGLRVGEPPDVMYPPDRAHYTVMSLGLRKDFWPVRERGWTPWVHLGLGIADITWDTVDYDVLGGGLMLAAGADKYLGGSLFGGAFLLRGQWLHHGFSVDSPDTSFDLDGNVFSVMIVWHTGLAAQGDAEH